MNVSNKYISKLKSIKSKSINAILQSSFNNGSHYSRKTLYRNTSIPVINSKRTHFYYGKKKNFLRCHEEETLRRTRLKGKLILVRVTPDDFKSFSYDPLVSILSSASHFLLRYLFLLLLPVLWLKNSMVYQIWLQDRSQRRRQRKDPLYYFL